MSIHTYVRKYTHTPYWFLVLHRTLTKIPDDHEDAVSQQDCSKHRDTPAHRTAVRHGARTLSQVSGSRGPPAWEGLVGRVLCSPTPREECRRGQGRAKHLHGSTPAPAHGASVDGGPAPTGLGAGTPPLGYHGRRGSEFPFPTTGRGCWVPS